MKTETWRYRVNEKLDAECHYGGDAQGCGHYEVWVETEEYEGGERSLGELQSITRDTTKEMAQRICQAMNGDFVRIGDKMSDAAQAIFDHGYIGTADGYDAKMHRLELEHAIQDWLWARKESQNV